MGSWGPKLYQDDLAEDIKDYYKDQLHRGKTGSEITQDIIRQNEFELSDEDEAPVFWFALADTQWKLGRLEDFVKENALYHIKDGSNLRRWQEEDPKAAKVRAKVLLELKDRLLTPQPAEKKVSQYRLYQCEWEVGDVYAYRFNSEESKDKGFYNKYMYFVKVGEAKWHPGHVVPLVYFYKRLDDEPTDIESLKGSEYLIQGYRPTAYENSPNKKRLYLSILINTSKRIIPQNQLTYLGKIEDVKRIENENLNPSFDEWKRFESYMIKQYTAWKDTTIKPL